MAFDIATPVSNALVVRESRATIAPLYNMIERSGVGVVERHIEPDFTATQPAAASKAANLGEYLPAREAHAAALTFVTRSLVTV